MNPPWTTPPLQKKPKKTRGAAKSTKYYIQATLNVLPPASRLYQIDIRNVHERCLLYTIKLKELNTTHHMIIKRRYKIAPKWLFALESDSRWKYPERFCYRGFLNIPCDLCLH